MIQDAAALRESQEAWAGVRGVQTKLKVGPFASTTTGTFSHSAADACNNLVLVFAYAVLNDMLAQLRDEGRFPSRSSKLGALMAASQTALPWQDFETVDRGRARRNEVAHEGNLLPRGECWQYIDAVERELRAWNVIPAAA